ncbi:unnamed protein product [Arabis nemorensis]|uniref:Uncharacterized protein n=1 Tax=Arabis nemorensis TaxID=586526 RepID=A0A565C981_9BRAS|nr:unnamed protein product [Arabis nemorensis]
MGRKLLVCIGALFLILFTIFPSSRALISSPHANPPYPKAISMQKKICKKLKSKSLVKSLFEEECHGQG